VEKEGTVVEGYGRREGWCKVKTILRALVAGVLMLPLAFIMPAASYAASRNQAPRDPALYQAWLTQQVHHQLVMLPWLTIFDNLEYRVEGDKVVLMGQVVRPVLKDDAGAVVKKIEGVRTVENDIEVLPVSPMDDQIRWAEFRAIYGYPVLERYAMGALPPIHIIVKGGHVTLEGVVANQTDKELVYMRANGVPNTFSVTNNLQVENAKKG
jgi:hyperosmotically inducible periplasmic protein